MRNIVVFAGPPCPTVHQSFIHYDLNLPMHPGDFSVMRVIPPCTARRCVLDCTDTVREGSVLWKRHRNRRNRNRSTFRIRIWIRIRQEMERHKCKKSKTQKNDITTFWATILLLTLKRARFHIQLFIPKLC
jgi:hypothetical protein